jgi:hypothetical protein
MKTLAKVPMQLEEVEFIPEKLEEGKFYYSEKYQTATHLCPCGCGQHFAIQIKENEWTISQKKPLTVTPSLWHKIQCKSHYVINNGFTNILNYPEEKNQFGGWGDVFETHAPNGCPM